MKRLNYPSPSPPCGGRNKPALERTEITGGVNRELVESRRVPRRRKRLVGRYWVREGIWMDDSVEEISVGTSGGDSYCGQALRTMNETSAVANAGGLTAGRTLPPPLFVPRSGAGALQVGSHEMC